jgi:hypothetical protein
MDIAPRQRRAVRGGQLDRRLLEQLVAADGCRAGGR